MEGCTSSLIVCRHLLFLLGRFLKCSRHERPGGSLPAFARDDLSIPIPSVTEGRLLFPPSATRCPIGSPYGCLPKVGGHRAYRVPRRYQSGLGPRYSPVALGVHERAVRRASTRHSAFWLKPISIFGLFWVTAFIKRLHMLTIPLNPSLRSALMLADPDAASRFCQ